MKTSAYQNNGTLVKLFCRLLQIGVVRVRGVLRSRSLRGHQSTVQNTVITMSEYVIKIQHIVKQCTGVSVWEVITGIEIYGTSDTHKPQYIFWDLFFSSVWMEVCGWKKKGVDYKLLLWKISSTCFFPHVWFILDYSNLIKRRKTNWKVNKWQNLYREEKNH